jgi:hypothetical protein
MHRGEVHPKARMSGQPVGGVEAMRCADMITHEMTRPEGCRNLPVHVLPKGQACCLPVAVITRPVDLTGAGLSTLVFLLKAVGPVVGLSGQGRSRARLQRSLLSP